MSNYLGIDTSNYTTSSAICNSELKIKQFKKLLPVKQGECGLRQSDALFHHVQQLPEILSDVLPCEDIKAVGVSSMPRRLKGSYMPCFTAGICTAKAISKALNVPLYEFSHQEGHIAAALYGAGKLEFLGKSFIAFHISGGTTEALLVTPSKDNPLNCNLIAQTLDLNAGQLVDRVGIMLGLDFPCGMQIDKLAREYDGDFNISPSMKGNDICLSGVQNQCMKMLEKAEPKEKIAAYCIEYILNAVLGMTQGLITQYGKLPLIYAGGVMSNSIIKKQIIEKYGGYFAPPEFSSDNAVGVSLLTALNLEDNFVHI